MSDPSIPSILFVRESTVDRRAAISFSEESALVLRLSTSTSRSSTVQPKRLPESFEQAVAKPKRANIDLIEKRESWTYEEVSGSQMHFYRRLLVLVIYNVCQGGSGALLPRFEENRVGTFSCKYVDFWKTVMSGS